MSAGAETGNRNIAPAFPVSPRRVLGAHLVGQDLVVTVCKCCLVVRLEEVLELLKQDPDLWRLAIARGKYQRRGEATARRLEDRSQGGPADG